MLPYTQARASMFDDLVQQKTIKPYQFHGKASSDDALVEKILDKMVPRLKDLIESTIQSALRSHILPSSHQLPDPALARTTSRWSLDLDPPLSPASAYGPPAPAWSDHDPLEDADPNDPIHPNHVDHTISPSPSP